MTEYGTIKIPRGKFEEHNQRRQDLGLTWVEYIDGQAPEPASVDVDKVSRRVVERLEGSKPLAEMQFDDWFHKDHAQTVAYAIIDELDEVDFDFTDGASGVSYEDVVAASEQGTRQALEGYQG